MGANYDNSAWFYDWLSRLVYGRSVLDAQIWLLRYVPANSTVLIAGGGTGWILEELARIHSSGLSITYVEVSAQMMARAKKRNAGANTLFFVNDAVENIGAQTAIDVVITPFLFDSLTEQTIQKVFPHIHGLLKPGSTWLNADFQLTGKWWQRVLLRSMFLFFRVLCRIEGSQLPDIDKQFEAYGYELLAERTFFGDFIISEVYKQPMGDT